MLQAIVLVKNDAAFSNSVTCWVFLILTYFYMLIVHVEGYCLTWPYSTTDTPHSVEIPLLGIGP